jgi:hypothetical protein
MTAEGHVYPLKTMTAPCKQIKANEKATQGGQEEPRRTIWDSATSLTYMECFSSATNLFGFLRLSEILVE